MDWNRIADKQSIEKTISALAGNGVGAVFVEDEAAAKQKVLEMIPEGAEVFTMTSKTLDETGIAKEINESGKYDSVRQKLSSMDRATQSREMAKLGAAPDYAVASVHAVTEDGKVLIASNTGSQLAAEVYGSPHVIWVVGANKIVADQDLAIKRIYEHVLPLESERAHQAYGVPGSFVSKLLIFNKEVVPNRIHMIIVNKQLGF